MFLTVGAYDARLLRHNLFTWNPATSRLKIAPGVEWNRDRKEVHIGDRRESDEDRSVEVWRDRWKGGKWREREEVRPDGLTEKIISCGGRSSPLPIRLCLHDVLRGLRHREESEMIVRWSEPLENFFDLTG